MPYPGQLFHYIDGTSSTYEQFEDTINTMRASATSGHRFKVLKKIVLTALSLIMLFLPQSLFDLITLYSAGFITDTNHFAAIGLTLVCSNLAIRRMITCCTTTMQALIKQALDHQHYHRISAYYQKTVLLMVIWTILVISLLIGFGFILNLLKFSPEFGSAFRFFNYVLIPSYFANLSFTTTKSLYLSYGIIRIPIYFMWSRMALSIIMNIIFYKVFGPGLLSVGVARSVTETVAALSLYYYTRIKNKFAQALGCSWTSRSFHHLGSFLLTLLKRGAAVYLSRISFDLLILIVVFLGQTEAIAAQACVTFYAIFLQVIPLALCLSTYKYFSSAVEEGNEYKAKNYALTGSISCFAICLLITGLNFAFLYNIPKAFWGNPYFQEVFSTIIVLYSITIWVDMAYHIFSIAFKRLIGRRFVLKSGFICLIILGLPLSVILGFWAEWRVSGIWIGRLISFLLVNVVLLRKAVMLDWWQQLRRLHFDQKERFDDTPLDF